jgi:hypothetical protein
MTRGRAALISTVVAGVGAGCAHAPRADVARDVAELRCDEAAQTVAARPRTHPLDELRRSATTPLSLVATGAGWVTDGALVVSAGVTAGGLVCVPIFALEVAAKGDGRASAECFVRVGAGVMEVMPAPGIGRGVYRATRSWRCPDFVQLAREVRAVAACYEARGAPGDGDVGAATLEELRTDREIWECLPAGERGAIDAARARAFAPPPP